MKFIVAYNSHCCAIEPLEMYDNPSQLELEYDEACNRKHYEFGEFFGFNNRLFGVVRAKTAAEALKRFLEKQKERAK